MPPRRAAPSSGAKSLSCGDASRPARPSQGSAVTSGTARGYLAWKRSPSQTDRGRPADRSEPPLPNSSWSSSGFRNWATSCGKVACVYATSSTFPYWVTSRVACEQRRDREWRGRTRGNMPGDDRRLPGRKRLRLGGGFRPRARRRRWIGNEFERTGAARGWETG
jgi:hypothetical protein